MSTSKDTRRAAKVAAIITGRGCTFATVQNRNKEVFKPLFLLPVPESAPCTKRKMYTTKKANARLVNLAIYGAKLKEQRSDNFTGAMIKDSKVAYAMRCVDLDCILLFWREGHFETDCAALLKEVRETMGEPLPVFPSRGKKFAVPICIIGGLRFCVVAVHKGDDDTDDTDCPVLPVVKTLVTA